MSRFVLSCFPAAAVRSAVVECQLYKFRQRISRVDHLIVCLTYNYVNGSSGGVSYAGLIKEGVFTNIIVISCCSLVQ